jgi:hypothetical protein
MIDNSLFFARCVNACKKCVNAGFLLTNAKTNSKVGWEKQENIPEFSYKKY